MKPATVSPIVHLFLKNNLSTAMNAPGYYFLMSVAVFFSSTSGALEDVSLHIEMLVAQVPTGL